MGSLHPIMLNRMEVCAAQDTGGVEIHRPLPGGDMASRAAARYGRPGDRLWVREAFATRQDGQQLKIRYPADGTHGQPRLLPLRTVEPKYRTEGYVTRPAKYMPRWASRLMLEVTESQVRRSGQQQEILVRARVVQTMPDRTV
jgi:hypothetical protein